MNYYVEYFWHCWRVVFNFFSKPYCAKWDALLKEIMELGDEDVEIGLYTITFHYKGKAYTVWVSNGFYAAGYLYQLDRKHTLDITKKRPSFKTQFQLLQMEIDYKKDKEQKAVYELEQQLYGSKD